MRKLLFNAFLLSALVSTVNAAMACGWDGCLFSKPGDFVSNAARDVTAVATTNVQQSLAIAQNLSQGDVNGAMQHVGKLVVEGECIGCKQAISQIAGDASVGTVEQMVTDGFIVMTAVEGDPLFVTYDAVSQKAFVSHDTTKSPNPARSPSPGASKKVAQTFSSTTDATCIVASTNNKGVVVGFPAPPRLKNSKTNAEVDLFTADLEAGDQVSVEAKMCPKENSPKNHQKSLDKATIVFIKDYLPHRTGQVIKYEMIGTLAK